MTFTTVKFTNKETQISGIITPSGNDLFPGFNVCIFDEDASEAYLHFVGLTYDAAVVKAKGIL
jgi:hypothetical protein